MSKKNYNEMINPFKEKLFAAAKEKGFSDWELYANISDSFRVMIFKGEISEYKNALGTGISFRGNYKGKMGYAYSERIDDDVIPFLIENAAQNAEIIEDPDTVELYPGDAKYEDVKLYDDDLSRVPVDEKISKALEMERIASGLDKRIAGIDYSVTGSEEGYRFIANSLGLNMEESSNIAQAFVLARVAENGQVKADRDYWAGHNWNEYVPEKLAHNAVNNALSLLGARPVKSGVYDILLEADDASAFFGAFSGVFSAERVQKGFSLLKGKIGQTIAAPNIYIRDDPLLPLKAGSCAFDDEGVAAKNKLIVDKGVLLSFLHNTKTAKKDGLPSTGNGFKAGFKASIDVSPSNLYIVPSSSSKDDLIGEIGNGLIIKDLSGLHAGINPISGDFSIICGGYVIEKGIKSRPVEQITIAGNFFTVLNNIEKAANDLDQLRSPVASPSLWIKGINVSGEN